MSFQLSDQIELSFSDNELLTSFLTYKLIKISINTWFI